MNNNLLYYLDQNKSYQLLKDLINTSFGFDLSLIDSDGRFTKPIRKLIPSSPRGASRETNSKAAQRFSNAQLLHELKHSREAVIAETGDPREKEILVPVIRQNRVVGFVYVNKEKPSYITDSECQTVLHFLTDYINRLVTAELEFIDHFQDGDMTHQQHIVRDILEYVREHYSNPQLTLKYVCLYKGISYHHLSRVFKKEMNISFNTYVNNLRLDKAAKLLKGNMPINQIARNCGFDDPGYFSKSFKKKMGASPVEYRNRFTQERKRSKAANLFR